jgi:hypothetical protein
LAFINIREERRGLRLLEKGTEENVWTCDGKNKRMLEKTA